ncbi:conserved hypothetical protein [Halobacteriovorax marinus SJ]|uniref:Ribosomal RNA small subunit methyltransferase E n=1 Tax=Halobacteriovorax marinus (strain ATCC BAA-682 / DSM 15412 / SJ) TaxID=862908 RepID=E1X261_HALMS|nr:RsmE family RNA methyltransferase [Halobacteriovorax marinus]CBW25017.1 conserved hypothetical protein [Halobacteriovorax marinus SJ]
MRAVYIDREFLENELGQEIQLSGDSARHLIKVIRIKKNETILLLNGKGQKCEARSTRIDRREIDLEILSINNISDDRKLSLFLGLPKKDAFESIVKMASEIGIKNIYLYRAEYSQQDIEFTDRLLKLEESAIIQSNNPFRINFLKVDNFSDAFKDYSNVVHFSTFSSTDADSLKFDSETLLVIGPEAGFSQDEEDQIKGFENVSTVKLDTYIMRAPTALAVASGYILKSF